jgi:hypothetical protein
MLIKKPNKISKLTALIFLLGLCTGFEANAADCGVVHYVENKSNGVDVTSNKCGADNNVAVGSTFNLMPGARLWIKSPLNPEIEKHYHAICQNRSPASIAIGVDEAALPWISPKGLKNCSGWIDNKLHCDGENGEQNALYCVIAEIAPSFYLASNAVERTTSVTMRSLKPTKPHEQAKAAQSPAGFDQAQIVAAMRPETELCRTVYQPGGRVKIEWVVDTNGQAANLSPQMEPANADNAGGADKGFIDCVTDVVKSFPYPKPAKHSFLSASF